MAERSGSRVHERWARLRFSVIGALLAAPPAKGALLEAEDLAPLWVDAGHDMPDGTVLSCRVHCLKNQQGGVAIGHLVEMLQRAEPRNVLRQPFFIMLLRRVHRIHVRRPLPKVDLVTFLHPEILGADIHPLPLVGGAIRGVARHCFVPS